MDGDLPMVKSLKGVKLAPRQHVKARAPRKVVLKPAPTTPANYIRQWREYRGIDSQAELARRTGLTRPTITRLERNNQGYRQRYLELIAAALDCTPAQLIGTDPNNVPAFVQIWKDIPREQHEHALELLRVLVPKTPSNKA